MKGFSGFTIGCRKIPKLYGVFFREVLKRTETFNEIFHQGDGGVSRSIDVFSTFLAY